MRPISPAVHGVLDYTSVAALLVLSRGERLPAALRSLLRYSALFSLLYSLLTRYRFGVVKVLPMRAHLALDLSSAAALLAGPEVLGVHEAGARRLLRALGIYETVVPLLTRPGADPGEQSWPPS